MRIFVCIKQVPASSLPLDAGGNLVRCKGETRLNPGDLQALEAGRQLKSRYGGVLTALTMGPGSSEAVLKTALALGADQAVRMTDPAFAGADVYATGYTLAQGVRALGGADLILCGESSTDGDTAQLPFSLAAQLGLPAIGWIKKLVFSETGPVAWQELSLGTQKAEVPTRALLAVGKACFPERSPSLRDQLRARGKQIRVLTLMDLEDRDPAHYGTAGSATAVIGVRTVADRAKQTPLRLEPAAAAQKILGTWKEEAHGN